MNLLEALATGKRIRLPGFRPNSWIQQRGLLIYEDGDRPIDQVPQGWLLRHDWEVLVDTPELVEYFEVIQATETHYSVRGLLSTEEEVVRQKLTPTGRSWRLPRKTAP